MNSVRVEYIGAKPTKTDNVGGTGILWQGQGDVKEVPIAAWAKMAKHTDVWRAVEGEQPAPRTLASATAPAPVAAPAPAPAMVDQTDMLYGTDHPALIEIAGEQVQLGTLVAAAHASSELSVDDWNSLADADRHDFVEAEIEARRIAAADAQVKAAADAAKADVKPARVARKAKESAPADTPAPKTRGKRAAKE